MDDRQLGLETALRKGRQARDVLPLHREAAATPAEQEVEELLEEIETVQVREAAVEHARVRAEARLGELHGAHRWQHLLAGHRLEAVRHHLAQRLSGQEGLERPE